MAFVFICRSGKYNCGKQAYNHQQQQESHLNILFQNKVYGPIPSVQF